MRACVDLQPFLAQSRLGKKSGRGFYEHRGAKKGADPALAEDLTQVLAPRGNVAAGLSDDELSDRLVFAMLAEALRALDESVVASASELDLATVLGMGFPPFRGGLMRWERTLGAAEVARRLDELARSPGVAERLGGPERFTVEGRLVEQLGSTGASAPQPPSLATV